MHSPIDDISQQVSIPQLSFRRLKGKKKKYFIFLLEISGIMIE
jgi:hypothetical protein